MGFKRGGYDALEFSLASGLAELDGFVHLREIWCIDTTCTHGKEEEDWKLEQFSMRRRNFRYGERLFRSIK